MIDVFLHRFNKLAEAYQIPRDIWNVCSKASLVHPMRSSPDYYLTTKMTLSVSKWRCSSGMSLPPVFFGRKSDLPDEHQAKVLPSLLPASMDTC